MSGHGTHWHLLFWVSFVLWHLGKDFSLHLLRSKHETPAPFIGHEINEDAIGSCDAHWLKQLHQSLMEKLVTLKELDRETGTDDRGWIRDRSGAGVWGYRTSSWRKPFLLAPIHRPPRSKWKGSWVTTLPTAPTITIWHVSSPAVVVEMVWYATAVATASTMVSRL